MPLILLECSRLLLCQRALAILCWQCMLMHFAQ